jgi:hypothetical protein
MVACAIVLITSERIFGTLWRFKHDTGLASAFDAVVLRSLFFWLFFELTGRDNQSVVNGFPFFFRKFRSVFPFVPPYKTPSITAAAYMLKVETWRELP